MKIFKITENWFYDEKIAFWKKICQITLCVFSAMNNVAIV